MYLKDTDDASCCSLVLNGCVNSVMKQAGASFMKLLNLQFNIDKQLDFVY